jgi:hypothetical protein
LRVAGLGHKEDIILRAILSRILFVFKYLSIFIRKANKGPKHLK